MIFGKTGNDYSNVVEWVKERLERDARAVVKYDELYADYLSWCGDRAYHHSKHGFGKVLKAVGAGRNKHCGVRYSTGFRIRDTI